MYKYQYGFKNKFLLINFPLWTTILGTPFFFLYSLSIFIRVQQGFVILTDDLQSQMIVAFLWSIIWPFSALQGLNMYPLIELDDRVLRVRYFSYWWKWIEIPWDEILHVSEVENKLRGVTILSIGVEEDLSLWHKLLRKRYGTGNNSQIFVTSYLSNFDEFRKTLKNSTKELV